MKSKLQAMAKELEQMAQSKMAMRGLQLFVQAPDEHLAAAVLTTGKFNIQDRKEMFDTLILLASAADQPCPPALKEKLQLLNLDTYHGCKLF